MARAGADPGQLTEAVGDANAIEATGLGVRNLRRVMDILLTTATEPGQNWDELEELYGRLLGQWVREMNHVGAPRRRIRFCDNFTAARPASASPPSLPKFSGGPSRF